MVSGRLAVVGQGYVGLPLAMRAVEVGWDVVGFETAPERLLSLKTAESYVEDVPSGALAAALVSGRYHPSDDPASLAGFDVAVITVPTPLRDGVPDLLHVEDAARLVAGHLRGGATVVLESTTYPGTTEELLVHLLEAGSGLRAGPDFHAGYSPERIDPGNATWTFVTTPKLVAGIDPASADAVEGFYAGLVNETVRVASCAEAELAKLIENTFRHVNVALVNELAMFAGELGVDIWEAIRAASTKPFGFMAFQPGPGVGGHCLPIDPTYLSWRVKRRTGKSFRFVELANDLNDHMPDYVVRRLVEGLNRRRIAPNGARVLLVGMAYKADTSDLRESPALGVAERLVALGAEVRVADGLVRPEYVRLPVTWVEPTAEEAAGADAVVVLSPHAHFDLEKIAAAAPYVLDTRNVVQGDNVERL